MLMPLDASPEPLLDLAPNPAQETIVRPGRDLKNQLGRKIAIMNVRWEDYGRLFTGPYP
jgi:hypothetical protein